MRVLQVSPAFAPHLGGVETCVREVSTRLAGLGVDVSILTADETHALPPRETVGELRVQRVAAYPRHKDYRLAPGIVPAVRRAPADLVHVQCYQSLVAPAAMTGAATAGKPFVVTFHGGGHSSRLRHRVRHAQLLTLRPLLGRASRLIATARWEIEHYSKILSLPTSRFALIPNGGDLPEPPPDEVDHSGTLIVSIGRAERYKGHHRVLAALPRVVEEFDDARLWIAGEGPYQDELQRMANELGVANRVEIRSVRDRAEYARRLAGASAAVLMSDFETHPMAALEAIKLGIPTLVADNSGLTELAQRGQARAVSLSAGSQSHAAELIDLIRAPRTGVKVSIPSWDECAAQHLHLYEEILAGPDA